jgi:antibiotic biosynthesis monooxygenase (ABM) superfamily enzyme
MRTNLISIPGRIGTPNQAAAGPRVPPPRHKMALLTWAGAWAMITLILFALGPAMATWPLALRTLVISVLMVLTLTWVVIPTLTRVFAGWLAPAPPAENRRTGRTRAGLLGQGGRRLVESHQ